MTTLQKNEHGRPKKAAKNIPGVAAAQLRESIGFLCDYRELQKKDEKVRIGQCKLYSSGFAYPPTLPHPLMPPVKKVLKAIDSVSLNLDEGVQGYGTVRNLLRNISENFNAAPSIKERINAVLSG